MELMQAHEQWATRPADERFQTLDELHAACDKRDRASFEDAYELNTLTAQVEGGAMSLNLPGGRLGFLSPWSARQFLSRISTPADFIPRIDEGLATQVLNNRLARTIDEIANEETQRDGYGRMLLQNVGGPESRDLNIRAFYGSRYARLEDRHVTALLKATLPDGWKNPVAFKDGKWGAELVPSGLYASDRDMFAFFISGGDAVETGGPHVMHRGFFVWNSQVGAKDFGFTTFYMDRVCGNNIIWGATDVNSFRGKHTKGVIDVFKGFDTFMASLLQDASHDAFAAAIKAAKATIVASVAEDKEIESVDTMRKLGFSKAETVAALGAIRTEEATPVGSRFDWLGGYTAIARRIPNIDARVELETRAAAILLPAVAN